MMSLNYCSVKKQKDSMAVLHDAVKIIDPRKE